MAYRRRTKRRFYRKRRSSGLSNAYSLAKAAYKGFRFIKGIVNSELHVYDFNSSSAIDSTGEVLRLSGVAQSDDLTGRTGRSILAKSLQVRMRLTSNASATTPTQIRTIVGIDYDANTTLATIADVLSNIAASPLTAMRELDTDRGRFKILFDRTLTLPTVAAGNAGAFVNKYFKLGNHHIYFDNTTANSDAKGKLFMINVSNQATNTPGKELEVRMRFYDN